MNYPHFYRELNNYSQSSYSIEDDTYFFNGYIMNYGLSPLQAQFVFWNGDRTELTTIQPFAIFRIYDYPLKTMNIGKGYYEINIIGSEYAKHNPSHDTALLGKSIQNLFLNTYYNKLISTIDATTTGTVSFEIELVNFTPSLSGLMTLYYSSYSLSNSGNFSQSNIYMFLLAGSSNAQVNLPNPTTYEYFQMPVEKNVSYALFINYDIDITTAGTYYVYLTMGILTANVEGYP